LDVAALIRSIVSPDHADRVDAILRAYPVGEGGLDPRVVDELNREGVLSVRRLVEAVSDEPVRSEVGPRGRGRLQVLARLGRGAMGEVFLVFDRALARYVALKTMDGRLANDPGQRRRFEGEARITAQLEHPGIVAVYDADGGPGTPPTYTMKVVRGRTLLDMIGEAFDRAEAGRPEEEGNRLNDRLSAFLDVCDAVAYAHQRGVLHRDLKPENIMVGRFHETYVMDWGIAIRIGESDETPVGQVVGTPAYMSPEQAARPAHELDARSDQFALGIMLYELVTLRRARTGKTLNETITQAAQGHVRKPILHIANAPIPRELKAIIDKATQVRPSDRYDSVTELAEDIRRFMRDEPVKARPDTPAQALGRQISRHRTVALSLLFLLTVALLATLFVAVGGLVAVNEVTRYFAEQREARLSALTGMVNTQAHRIDTELLEHQGTLLGLAWAVEHALESEPPAVPIYTSDTYADATRGPPDLAPSPLYETPTSLAWPDIAVAPGVTPETIDRQGRQLTALRGIYRQTMLNSWGEEVLNRSTADQDKLLLEKGAPLVWAYAATPEGILVGYPGTGSYEEGYDPRTRPWYQVTESSKSPVWSALDADESGLGLLLTCSVRLVNDDGRMLGVAAVDLTFAHVIDELLEPPGGIPPGGEVWLIDQEGLAIIRSSQKGTAHTAALGWVPPPFPHADLLRGMRSVGSTGYLEAQVDGRPHLAVWSPVPLLGWTYLLLGPRDILME
jgi:serine/threonine-protein kinase